MAQRLRAQINRAEPKASKAPSVTERQRETYVASWKAVGRVQCTQSVPIIAVTASAMVGDQGKAWAAGCDGYIEKPIDPATLAEEIARFRVPKHASPAAP